MSCLSFIDFCYAFMHRKRWFYFKRSYDGNSKRCAYFFSIHAIRRSAIMWWIAVWGDGFDELKSNVKFIQYFHCGYTLKYSLKPAWKSILANWNYENRSYVLCNLNLVADFVQCIHKSFCIDFGTVLCGAIFRLKTINLRFTWIRLHSNNASLANGFDGMKWIR